MSDPVLAISGLRLSRAGREILRGVELSVERGEVLALMGLSGGGKTTITHALLLAGGRASACGPAAAVLAEGPLSACFGARVSVSREDGRWAARATPSW